MMASEFHAKLEQVRADLRDGKISNAAARAQLRDLNKILTNFRRAIREGRTRQVPPRGRDEIA